MKAPLSDLIRHFDAVAASRVDFSADSFGEWDTRLHQEVLNNAELDEDAVLLELGCGTGRFAHLLAPHIRAATAVDCSPAMLQLARARQPGYDKIRWLNGDMRELPDTPGLDTVVMCHALRYLDESERAALFAELHRRLPVGGLLVIGDILWSLAPDVVEGAEGWLDEEWAYVLDATAIERELQRAGFDTFVRRMHPALAVIRAAKVPKIVPGKAPGRR